MNRGWDPDAVPVLALAFVGDAVWHLYVRNHVLAHGLHKPNDLHRAATRYVRAEGQAAVLAALADELTPDELAVARRGRNAKSGHAAKHTNVLAYRHSTGFEALLGYLYGTAQADRLEHVCRRALAILDAPPVQHGEE